MEYSKEDKEFYELMRMKVAEIDFLNVSEEEKSRLYFRVEKTIERYEGNKNNLHSAKESLADISETWEKMGTNLMKIKDSAEVLETELSNLERMIVMSRIIMAGKKQIPERN